jgi:hypothetical protein
MAKRKQALHPDAPLLHQDHPRPVTRRDFLRQGFISGTGMVMGGSLLGLLTNPRMASALSLDLDNPGGNGLAQQIECVLGGVGSGKIPFICFDLAGGANFAGSNVLVGRSTPLDTLSTAGYSKLGLPGDMIPGVPETTPSFTGTSNGDHTDTTLGLPFHSDSAILRGILEKINIVGTAPNINGAVIPARSDNDTGNNPHNPMYGIAKAGINPLTGAPEGATGKVVTLIGSSNSESGGNSMAPAMMIDSELRPTKVDRPSDVTGMVDTGGLANILTDPKDVTAVMESVVRLSDKKLTNVSTKLGNDSDVKNLVRCGYLKSAWVAEEFVGKPINPDDRDETDGIIVGPGRIFSEAEFDDDREFRKTASVMKMVVDGYAGAGTISMGGYDYHTGDRESGERRDLRAGRCMGACLEYAARRSRPLMMYVFSDGSVASNGTIDNSVDGRGKGVWTGDNSSTACSFILVYNPNGPVTPLRQQIGYFRADGSVETASSPAANNVNLLVETVILNYMSLNGDIGLFPGLFTGFGASPSAALLDSLTAFGPLT